MKRPIQKIVCDELSLLLKGENQVWEGDKNMYFQTYFGISDGIKGPVTIVGREELLADEDYKYMYTRALREHIMHLQFELSQIR